MEISFKKLLLGSIIGFGLGGIFWGLALYLLIPRIDYPLNIFAAFIGIFGGLGLTIFSKNLKLILKTTLFGFLGSLVGIFSAFLGIYNLSTFGLKIISFFVPQTLSEKNLDILNFSSLNPSLPIWAYWLNFLLMGLVIGLFLFFSLRKNFWFLILSGSVGFGISSIIGPIFGNLLGNALDSVLLSYLFTFLIIGVVLGLFFAWGAHSGLVRPSKIAKKTL